WHFWYSVGFCGESGLRKVGLCGIHPLTQRYIYIESRAKKVVLNGFRSLSID
ncbi:TPA: DUF3265 domain-containing protein, partial [Vibrio vulnificus]|nr:DUF3265 domain-containing protein [Vibrio vulnificus]